jgi:mRNA interferase RelE/StbE
MQIIHTAKFEKDYINAPAEIQKAFDKQENLLIRNLKHPSLRAKKYDESIDLWQARINRSWRFYFTIENDIYILHTMMPHR